VNSEERNESYLELMNLFKGLNKKFKQANS